MIIEERKKKKRRGDPEETGKEGMPLEVSGRMGPDGCGVVRAEEGHGSCAPMEVKMWREKAEYGRGMSCLARGMEEDTR